MNTNMVKSTAAIAVLGAICGACTFQTEETSENQESVATTTAPLPADAGGSFEHILSQNMPLGKSTNVCELTLPNMDPSVGAFIGVWDVTNSVEDTNIHYGYHWIGSDIIDGDAGKPKDKVEITGCTAGGDCRLKVRMTTKGNNPDDHLGCIINVEAPYDQPTVGYVGWSDGNRVISVAGGTGVEFVKAQGRQKMYTNADWTALNHQCTPRTYQTTGRTGMDGIFLLYANASALDSAINSVEPPPTFPTLLEPSGMSGRWLWGTESTSVSSTSAGVEKVVTGSTRAKHILPYDIGLVPGDWMWCQSFVDTYSTAQIHGALMNIDIDNEGQLIGLGPADPNIPGMVLDRYNPSASAVTARAAVPNAGGRLALSMATLKERLAVR